MKLVAVGQGVEEWLGFWAPFDEQTHDLDYDRGCWIVVGSEDVELVEAEFPFDTSYPETAGNRKSLGVSGKLGCRQVERKRGV